MQHGLSLSEIAELLVVVRTVLTTTDWIYVKILLQIGLLCGQEKLIKFR